MKGHLKTDWSPFVHIFVIISTRSLKTKFGNYTKLENIEKEPCSRSDRYRSFFAEFMYTEEPMWWAPGTRSNIKELERMCLEKFEWWQGQWFDQGEFYSLSVNEKWNCKTHWKRLCEIFCGKVIGKGNMTKCRVSFDKLCKRQERDSDDMSNRMTNF